MPQRIIEALRGGEGARDLAQRLAAAMPQIGAICSGAEVLRVLLAAPRSRCVRSAMNVLVDEALLDDRCGSSRSAAPRRCRRRTAGCARHGARARCGAGRRRRAWRRAAAAFFIHVAATGWFDGRVGADQEDHLGLLDVGTWLRHRARADAFEQRGHADEAWHRRVQWSTLLVPKPVRTSFWNRYASSLVPLALPKPASARGPSASRTRFRPFGGAGRAPRPSWPRGTRRASASDRTREVRVLRHAVAAHERLGEALRVVHVVEAEAALHAQALVVGGPSRPSTRTILSSFDVVGELAADAAVRADRIDLLVGRPRVGRSRGRQRAGGAGLHAFAAGHARATRPSGRRGRRRSVASAPRKA